MAGWIIGIGLLIAISGLFDLLHISGKSGQGAIGLGMGMGVGIMQWLIIRKYVNNGLTWVWCLLGGLGIPFLVYDYLSTWIPYSADVMVAVSALVGAVITSLLQYYFVLKPVSSRAKLWIPYSTVGWVSYNLLFGVSMALDVIHMRNVVGIILAFTLVLGGGPLMGYITGAGLKKVFSSPGQDAAAVS
ncbi:MAG: hypothetical protein JNL40_05200 [Cyclobacteriaceae bacterium]|nr:hypothetical protein [Cyclobacteriaceae bacterium]